VIPAHSAHTKIASSSILAAPATSPGIKGLTDIDSAYKVAQPESAVLAYEKTHLPRGARLEGTGNNCIAGTHSLVLLLSVPVTGSHEYSAALAIGIASLGKNSSLLRVDAQVGWVANRSAAEKAQSSAPLRLTVYRSNQFGGNVTVTLSGAQERQVTGLLNSLPLAAATQCAEAEPLYQLQYGGASPAFQATGYGCAGAVAVAMKGKIAAPLRDTGLSVVRLLNKFLAANLRISGDNSAGGWAGWVNVNPPKPPGSYQSAFAMWTVPKVSCDFGEMAAASEWVGIDGFNESTVEQTGTETDCVLGQGTYGAWFELFGTPVDDGFAVDLPGNDHIHPGDRVSAQVVAGQGSGGSGFPGAGEYLFYMFNFTEGWSWQIIEPSSALTPAPPNQTLEWIVEQPSCFWVCQALAQYGQVSFTGMELSLNTFAYPFGPAFPPSKFQGFPVDLVTGGTLKETGSNLVNGNTENVTFVHK
jgi:Peptidase A4 family